MNEHYTNTDNPVDFPAKVDQQFGFTIDYDVADKITVKNLIESYHTLQQLLDNHMTKGAYMHPDDVSYNHKMVVCLKEVIGYFGGEV